MKNRTWTIDDSTTHIFARDEKEALAILLEVQSIDGSRVERDGLFLYAPLNDENGDGAERDLVRMGFTVESI